METKKQISIMALLMMIGLIIGTVAFCATGNEQFLNGHFNIISKTYTLGEIFLSSFLPTAVMILLLFIFGFCAIGQPFALIMLLYRGIELGVAGAFAYHTYGASGFWIILILMLPNALLTSVLLIMGVRETLRYANGITKFIVSDKCFDGIRQQTKIHMIRFSVLLGLLILSSTFITIIRYLFTDLLLN